MGRQQESNKNLVQQAFRDVFESDGFDETVISHYFTPHYRQTTDGTALDFPAFLAHVRGLKGILKNLRVRFERLIAEGENVVSIHVAEAEKADGTWIAVRVFALFVIDAGKIAFCDELTHLEHGAAEDRNLGSRVPGATG
jgi:predicted SnoaL-like aldol condensation-catalyzing enzyme